MRICHLLGLILVSLSTCGFPVRAADEIPPTLQNVLPSANSTVVELRRVEVFFTEDVQGVDAADLLINGSPATNMVVVQGSQYQFEFPVPPVGTVQVQWAAGHGITDLEGNPFAGGSWTYHFDPGLALYRVRINEFMADNEAGIRDEDGSYEDWIELYNASTLPVNLDGCWLTDTKVPLTNWRLPAFTMPPNTYLIVWASGKNRSNPAAPLHTNFRLSNGGEYLALVDPTGTNIISHFDPTYPVQRVNTSYGRDPLDPSVTGYYPTTNATPGAVNTTSSGGVDFAPEVQFSRESGTFTETFTLTLYTESPTAEIRYVLVSTNNRPSSTVTNVPSASSPIYTGPITVDQTMQVRARAFETGKLPSAPISKNYIQISPDVINFSSDLPLVIIHNFGQGTLPGTGDQTAIIATFDNDLDRASLTNKPNLITRIGVNDRGSSTQGQAKQNMAVEFWDEFNQDTDHPLLGMPAESDWVFFSINNFDQGLMHNAVFHWFGRTVGYSSRTRYVEVFRKTGAGPVTAADYFGMFLVEEKPKRNANRVDIASLQPENTNSATVSGGYLLRIDRVDADERTVTVPTINTTWPIVNSYGGQAVIVDYPNSIQWATDPRRAPQRFYLQNYFTNFIRALTSSNWNDPATGYASYIDVDNWVDNHIINTICFNVDGYRLSGYFYKDRDGKLMQGPPWDCDRCLGTGGGGAGATPSTDSRPFNPRVWRVPTTSVGADNGTDFFGRSDVGVDWWDRLFRDNEFWQRWIDRYQELRATLYTDDAINAMVDGFYEEIKEAQAREHARWTSFTFPRNGVNTANGYSYDFGARDTRFTQGGYYTNEINFQKKWLRDRLNFMDTNFLARPTASLASGQVNSGATVTVQPASKSGSVLYYTLDGTDPRLPGGAINPAALSSAAPVTLTITSNQHLIARSYNVNHANVTNRVISPGVQEVGNPHSNSFWSGPISQPYYLAIPALRITEIMYHPAAAGVGDTNDQDNFEYIEVRNTGATPLNVNRFKLHGGVDFTFPNVVLTPGQYAVIVRNQASFQARYGASALILGVYTNDFLNNAGDRLILEGRFKEPILDFSYNDGWYPITDGSGFSLQIVDDSASTTNWVLKASWRPSGVVNGTPGATDTGAPSFAAVYVNEVLPNTDPNPTDAIELFNASAGPANIGGWFLTDNFNSPKKYRIPDGTTIPAGGYLAFVQNTSFGNGATGFGLSSKGESVYVFSADAAGNLTGYYHGFDFGPQSAGATFGRHVISTGGDQFVTQASPTLGAANAGPLIGPMVITEINYHPPDITFPKKSVDNEIDEYIELQNISSSSVQLFDPAHPENTWRLRDAVDFTFPPGVIVPAGGYILVVSFNPTNGPTLDNFRAVNGVPASTPIYGPWSGQLDNSADDVELIRPDVPDAPGTPTAGFVPYLLADKVGYEDLAPWPAGYADGLGASISRLNASGFGNDPANWVPGIKTPGAPLVTTGTAPLVTVQPTDTVAAETFSATFSISATGTGPLGYQWLFNGLPIRAPSSPTLVLNGLQLNQAGQYSCLVFGPAGIAQSSNATLTVRQVARITQNPVGRAVYIKPDPKAANLPNGTNVTFSVTATTLYPPLSYQWLFNGQAIPGATEASLTVTNVQLPSEGNYACAITDGAATIVSAAARLVPWISPVIVQKPVDVTVAAGSDFSLSVEVTGNPMPFAYSWRRNLGSIVINTNSGNYKTNFITLNTETALLRLTNNIQASNFVMRIVVYNDANTAPGATTTFNVTVLEDSDRDGIPNVVEATLGLDTNNPADATGDLDLDGMNNRAEFIAGTDPANNQSYLKIEQSVSSGSAAVQFAGISNRTYTVQFTDDLNAPDWSRLAEIAARSTNFTLQLPDPSWSTNRFYRVVTPRQ